VAPGLVTAQFQILFESDFGGLNARDTLAPDSI
jgi:hypothetical protein